MENYTRVPKQKDPENISPNEIRITSTGRTRRYISYSVALLDPTLLQHDDEDDKEQKEQQKDQKIYDFIVLKGMGQAINKTVTIAEVIKRRVAGLHQLNEIHSTTITDEWEPKEEGLEKHSTTRTVSAISITLSKQPLNVKDPGYQAPIAADLIQPMQPALPRKKKSEETTTTPATSSEWNTEEQQPAQEEKPKPKKKKTQRKKKQPADKQKSKAENNDQQQQSEQQEQGEVAAEKPKSDRPKKTRNNRKPRAETSSEPKESQSEETTGDNQKSESSTRGGGRSRGRGGKRYRGGYKKNRDASQGETATTSDNQTE